MATSEQQYSSSAKEIEELLASNYAELAKFCAFLSEKEHHAAYIVTKKKGLLGRRSSVPSEQNHSSIQRWQGDACMTITFNIFTEFHPPGSQFKLIMQSSKDIPFN